MRRRACRRAGTVAILAIASLPAIAADPAAELAPYVGKSCSGTIRMGRNVDTIVVNADGSVASHHRYTTSAYSGLHDGGLRPLTKEADGWWHFTSDSGSEQAYQPKDASRLTVKVKVSGSPEITAVYDCSP
jgi:hypothetical protein